MLDFFLRNAGCGEVSTAHSAVEAPALASDAERPFDVIVSDIGLPGMDGYQLAQALRSLPAYRTSLIIAVTGFVEYSDRARALQSGFDERLTKLINLGTLIKLIKRFNSHTDAPTSEHKLSQPQQSLK